MQAFKCNVYQHGAGAGGRLVHAPVTTAATEKTTVHRAEA